MSADIGEVWQRGPIEGVPALLQPLAHALLQAVEEAERYTENFPAELLWQRPADVASVGFHLLHIRGVVDRLFTYARGEALTADQLKELSAEKEINKSIQASDLVDAFRQQVNRAIVQLQNTPESTLTERRKIGRKEIPTTVAGLLFHAAEHTQRHIGQLLVTVRILQSKI
ncbi:MAG: DinB family protein [Cyclobacteriaceae bacterium]